MYTHTRTHLSAVWRALSLVKYPQVVFVVGSLTAVKIARILVSLWCVADGERASYMCVISLCFLSSSLVHTDNLQSCKSVKLPWQLEYLPRRRLLPVHHSTHDGVLLCPRNAYKQSHKTAGIDLQA